ncbi:MAG: lipopolysaccharide biosynthesis protein [Chthoniobacterales bacterium]
MPDNAPLSNSDDNQTSSSLGSLKTPIRNASKLSIGRIIQAVCSLAYLAFATRTLGPENFGKLILIHSLCLAVAQIARFDSWQSIVRFGTPFLHENQPTSLHRILSFGLALDFLGIVLGIAAYAIVVYPLGQWFGLSWELRHFAMLYGIWMIAFINSSGAATGTLQLLGRFGSLAIATTIEPIIRFVGAALLFYFGGELRDFLVLWLIALTVAHIATNFAAWYRLAKQGSQWRFRFYPDTWTRPQGALWRYALGTHWVGAMNVAQEHLPTLASGGVIGPAAAGLLKVARQFADVLAAVINKLLVPALFPELARLQKNARQALAKRLSFITLGIFFVFFMLLAFFGKDLIRLVAGKEFLPAYPVMLWLAFAGVIGSVSFSFETLLTAIGEIRRVVLVNSFSLFIYFLALAVLLPTYGLVGVGMAAVAYAAIRSSLLWWNARRHYLNS